jgi:DNA polymerase-3 subunit alpha
VSTGFVHLRVHTEYSLVDSVVRVQALVDTVAKRGMPAVAVTDECNVFAMVKFYRAALAAGVKPLIGVDLLLREEGERAPPARFTLLCQNANGYANLARLVTRAYREGARRDVPLLERAWLTRESLGGLIALSGATQGDIGRALAAGRDPDAARLLDTWTSLLGDRFYIELQRVGRPDEEAYIGAAAALAARRGVPVVATNDVRYLAATDFDSHEARVCIHDGTLLADPGRPRRYTPLQSLRSPAEMAHDFADIPEAIANTLEIARRCSLSLTLGEARLPEYPTPAGETVTDYLRVKAASGLEWRLTTLPGAERTRYAARLATELDVICQMGFAGYFLIVADFVRWARENGVPVGPGRGSGAGSVVAWVLRITDIDPLRYELLFERFLNPERVSMPDFDVDFCMDGRDRVIAYVADKYGHERVSQIITYGTMAAKAVVRDVGRVLGMSYGQVDRIARLIPFELGITLAVALEKEPELARLYRSDEEITNLIDLAQSLEGLTRNAGTHAGGVVIAPSLLTDFSPLYCEQGAATAVTQFDKDDVEAAGLVKFDFLGLRTLTVIDRAVATINALRATRSEPAIDIGALPMDDAGTYALMKSCRTTAVFQLESRGMKDLVRRLQPDNFEEIIALVALFRPGPLQSGMVDDFIDRKHGRGARVIDYLHPMLEPVLAPTYGVILYQEQVMQIAQLLAGYTLGGADLLRRAMGKKKPEEMAKQRSVFVRGATARGVSAAQAAHIFDLMEHFAGYGFNKSHSAAYALLAYQTAWLKAHFPAAYMAAVLSADMDHTDKIATMIDECANLGLKILPPHANASVHAFVVEEQAIRYGLGAIKGVGQGAVESLLAERTAHGPYRGLEDLCRRIDLARVNRRMIEALIRSGSLDGLGANRATMMSRLDAAIALGEQSTQAAARGQSDLFGLHESPAAPAGAAPVAEQPDFSESVRLAGERETLGLYLTGHPIDRYLAELPRFVTGRIGDLISDRPLGGAGEGARGLRGGRTATVAGLITEVRRRGTRTSVVLDDRSGRLEVDFFEDVFAQYRERIAKDAMVVIEGQLRFDEFIDGWRLAARKVTELDRVREQSARRLVLRCESANAAAFTERLAALLTPWRPGPCEVSVDVSGAAARAVFTLGAEWNVRATRELLEQLEQLAGRANLRVVHGPPPGVGSTMTG